MSALHRNSPDYLVLLTDSKLSKANGGCWRRWPGVSRTGAADATRLHWKVDQLFAATRGAQSVLGSPYILPQVEPCPAGLFPKPKPPRSVISPAETFASQRCGTEVHRDKPVVASCRFTVARQFAVKLPLLNAACTKPTHSAADNLSSKGHPAICLSLLRQVA